jgi:broad specificity phosphatase PhoE
VGREQAVSVLELAFAALVNENVGDLGTIQQAWAEEIERRARRVIAGESVGEPWEDVRERIERSLKER